MNLHQDLVIVVLTYNNFNELKKTLASIPEEFKNSIYIVNGGACEQTRMLVNSEFKGVSEKDRGISDAFSKGVKKTSGELIHFLNSGDLIYDKKFYKGALDLFQSDSLIDYVYSNILYKHTKYGDLKVGPNKKALKNIAFGMPFSHPGLIVRRRVFQQIGYFSDQYKIGMDYDFITRMMKASFTGAYLDLISVEMEGSGISSRKPLQSTLENLKSLRINNHFGPYEGLIIVYRLTRSVLGLFLGKIGFSSLIGKIHKK